MNARDIADAIIMGEADDDINMIVHAINERRAIVSRMQKASLRVGDRVRFTDQARNYAGQVGTLERKLQKNVEVRMDPEVSFQGEPLPGVIVRTPASLLERVEDES